MANILGSGGHTDTTDSDTRQAPALPAYDRSVEEAVHTARLYALCSIALDRPDDEFEALLADGAFEDELVDAARGIGDEDLVAAAERVAEYAADADADDLYYAWSSLFGVEEGVTVSPYELTYIPGPLLTTTKKLADIAGFYNAFGLQIDPGQNDRKDHVVFQTEFLSELSRREALVKDEGDQEGIEIVVDAHAAFVEDHLGRWYWRLAEEVSKHDGGFHAAVAAVLAALVELELDEFNADPDWVPDHPEVTEWTEDVFGDSGRGCGGCGIGDDTDASLDDTAGGGVPGVGDIPTGPEEFRQNDD